MLSSPSFLESLPNPQVLHIRIFYSSLTFFQLKIFYLAIPGPSCSMVGSSSLTWTRTQAPCCLIH